MSTTEEPQQASSGEGINKEFLQYIRERDQARETAAEKEKECNASKSKNYDLTKRVEELEEQIKELKKAKPKQQNGGGAKKQGAPKSTNQNKAQPPAKNKTITRAEKASKSPKKGTTHPIIPGKEIIADDSLSFYKEIAEICPDLTLSLIRRTEQLFIEGDVNGDGLIDVDELDNLFTKHFALYTRKQVEEILKSVDADGSMTLDFIEVLHVIHQVETGAKTNLPQGTVQKGSKGTAICSIQ